MAMGLEILKFGMATKLPVSMSNLYISDLLESVVMMDVLICDGSTENNYFENEAKRLLQRSGKGFSFLSFF